MVDNLIGQVVAYPRTQFCDRFVVFFSTYHRSTLWMTVFPTAILSLRMIMIRFSRTCCGLDSRLLANATSCQSPLFKSSLYNLRSSGSILPSMPAVRSKTLGDRAFMVAAPRLWNSLPKELRAIANVNSFKPHIKTYLFRTLYSLFSNCP